MNKQLRCVFIILMCITASFSFAQFPVGHQSLTYQDPARANRSVTTETYYPATAAGESTPVAAGQFPVIVFGHGFVMGYDAYDYFRTAIVPLGYIVVFATTEGSMSPVHAEFGLDLAFLLNKIKSESTNASSPFYNKIAPTSAIMGHSMGGGSSFLACENNTVPTCMVTFAAADTDPSAITAAANISIPALVIAGADDCVAAPAEHQIPMYDALASSCKVFISIIDGCHCYFGDYNFNCAFGEGTCNPVPALARADQQDATLDYVKIYLDYYLKGNPASWTTFNDSLVASPRITYEKSCATTGVKEQEKASLVLFPNPVKNILTICTENKANACVRISDLAGNQCLQFITSGKMSHEILVDELPAGIYIVEIINGNAVMHAKFIKE